jgi:hypothetical protein
MGDILLPSPKLPVCGIILADGCDRRTVLEGLAQEFGPAEDISPEKSFDDFSPYYEKEMGKGLTRFFVSFRDLMDPADLAGRKLRANTMEKRLSIALQAGSRTVNIDPGYMDLARLVVASTKDASYRVYLRDGIYAQPMLRFQHGAFVPFEWTYPDYQDRMFLSFFKKIRDKYKERTKNN